MLQEFKYILPEIVLILRVQSLIEMVMYLIIDDRHGDCICKIEVPSLLGWFKMGDHLHGDRT